MRLEFFVPGRITNPMNSSHGHWTRRARWAKRWRGATALLAREAMRTGPALGEGPKVIRFTGSVRRRFDDDNFRAACKPVRDGLKDAGIIHNDGPRSGHVFLYDQRLDRTLEGVWVVVEVEC